MKKKNGKAYLYPAVRYIAVIIALWFSVATVKAKEAPLMDNTRELFRRVQIFADAISIVSAEYVKTVEIKEIVYGAIRGMMKTLDGYSQFLDQESFREIQEETKGEFGGIGIEIGVREGVLTVITPIDGTPACRAGMVPGDRIVKIDGDITRDMTLNDAVKKLRGAPGTEVSITVVRENTDEMLDFKIERAVIKLQSIKDARLISGDIAYVRLVEFQERTARDLDNAIRSLSQQGAVDLILDLRNNPGGLLDSAVEVADIFLDPGMMIVYTEGRDPDQRTEFFSRKRPDHREMDIVVLVNRGSASASEILAGALQDNRRALVAGNTTFGKGSVQTVIPLKDNSALRLTTAAYYTPSGRNLMDKGIEPDVRVDRRDVSVPRQEDADDEDRSARSRIFQTIEEEKEDFTEDDAEDRLDDQIRAGVNILKGSRILKANRDRE